MKKILFVCMGNTCRSVMAGALARKLLAARPDGGAGVEVYSAGLLALPGDLASPGAVSALARLGVDPGEHHAMRLEPEYVLEADLVLTMETNQCRYIRETVPGAADKVHTLAGYAGDSGDIADPAGRPLEVYMACAARLEGLLASALDRLFKEAI